VVRFASDDPAKFVRDIGVIVKAKHRISFRQGLGQFMTITLRKTSDGNDSLRIPGILEIAGC
jgi:hypothetical protein